MSEQNSPTVNQMHELSLEQFVAHCRISYRSLRTPPRYVSAVVALADRLDACRDARARRDVEAANLEARLAEAERQVNECWCGATSPMELLRGLRLLFPVNDGTRSADSAPGEKS